MLLASCHCGSVEIRVTCQLTEVTECNCSICRRYGVLWAYFAPIVVQIDATLPTQTYVWGARTQAFHRCGGCGCVTHWAKFAINPDTIGINARLFPLEIIAGAQVRHLDGAVTDTYLDD